MSLNDTTMLVQPANNTNGSFGWGQEWIWIIVLFLFAGGWNRGWGGNDGATPYATSAVTQADLQRGFDTQGILTGISNIQNGLCSLGYDQLSQMNGINANIMQTGFGIQNQLCNMAAQNQSCCCETQRLIERGFADTNYNLATQSCDTRNTIQNSTRDIIDNANANSRAILDFLTNEKIDSLRTELTQAQAQLSQVSQTNTLINALRPCPVPAYIAPNPFCCNQNPCGCC